MDTLTLPALFKKMRTSTGRTQAQLASVAGIAHQSLQKFERGKASLAKETLKKMGKAIYINPEYIEGRFSYPFESNGRLIIKMFADDQNIFASLLGPLYLISGYASKIEVVCLRVPCNMIKKLYRKLGLPWYFAILFRDDKGNTFILRGWNVKNLTNFATAFHDLIFSISKSKCLFSIADMKCDNDLYDKIVAWDDLSKDDVEQLFQQAEFYDANKDITLSEEKILKLMRQYNIELFTELDMVIIKAMHEEKISHGEVLKYIRTKACV